MVLGWEQGDGSWELEDGFQKNFPLPTPDLPLIISICS